MRGCFKSVFIIFIGCCFMALLSSCTKKENIYQGIVQGIYEVTTQTHAMKKYDPTGSTGQEPPSYDQYERDRKKVIMESYK